MSPARWGGPTRRRRTDGSALDFHKAGAPWPTCSCLNCRRARRAEDRLDGTFAGAVERMREKVREASLRELRRPIYRRLRRPDYGDEE